MAKKFSAKKCEASVFLLLSLFLLFILPCCLATLSSSNATSFDDTQCPQCPSCFNCHVPGSNCLNGAECGLDGLCSCLNGWGDDTCSKPLCGSLSSPTRAPPPAGETCECNEGWSGVNCNVCLSSDVCVPIKGENATCVTNAVGVKEMYAWCDATVPMLDDTHVSLSCDWIRSECVFQFWISNEENFFCAMSNCSQEVTDEAGQNVFGRCTQSDCRCIPGTNICGGTILDMTDAIARVSGPTEWSCEAGQNCVFHELSTLDEFFVDGIGLNCRVGECLNATDIEEMRPIPKTFSRKIEMYIIAAILAGIIVLYAAFKLALHRQKKTFGAIQLGDDPDDNDDEGPDASEDTLENTRKQSTLVFSDVNYTVGGRKVLAGINGIIQPGHLCAIMGPSGAGKSSFLDILARKPKHGTVTGSVLIDGAVPTRAQFKKLAGYVDQEDTLMGTLTVRETLMYSALLRLPRKMPLRVKQRRVDDTMRELGIFHIADTRIGTPGMRGISGGEKRRVSIGKELVTSPSVLFCDEPTSGLDAYNALTVIECLSRLAKKGGRTVVITIHQPRGNIFKKFDELLLLAGGQTVYFGPASGAKTYFETIGHPLPEDYNLPDFLIDLTMRKPILSRAQTPPLHQSVFRIPLLSRSQSTTSLRPLENLAETEPTQIDEETGLNSELGDNDPETSTPSAHSLVESYKSSSLFEQIHQQIILSVGGEPLSVQPSGLHFDKPFSTPAFFHEFSLLSSRTFTNLYRNPFLFLAHFGISIILALLLGALFWQISDDLPGVQNRLGALFFMCALLGFASLSSLDLFAQERVLFTRERGNAYYGPASYFWSKVLFDILPLRVLPPLTMGSISYYMIGLAPNLANFGKFLLVLVLFNLVAAALCLCFATVVKSVAVANLLSVLTMLFAMLFGGFLLNKEHIPQWLSWIQHFSFFNYGYEALIVNELRDITLRDKTIVDIQIPGIVILSRFGFNSSAYWADVKALASMFVGLMTAAFLFLKFLVKERR